MPPRDVADFLDGTYDEETLRGKADCPNCGVHALVISSTSEGRTLIRCFSDENCSQQDVLSALSSQDFDLSLLEPPTQQGQQTIFVKIDHTLMNSRSWRRTSPAARAAYLELKKRYNGSNNGQIQMSVRELACALSVAKNTAHKYLRELENNELIAANFRGYFDRTKPQATLWRLTEL